MRTSDGYRFGLQFKGLSDTHVQVGELLESLGNKKSVIVVEAMLEYIQTHPEIINKDNPVRILVSHGHTRETIKAIVREILSETDDVRHSAGLILSDSGKDDAVSNADALVDLFLDRLAKFDNA